MTNNQIYNDINAAKDFIRRMNDEHNVSPTEWVEVIYHTKNAKIRFKIALLTVLYAGHWNLGWYGPEFMMPTTSDCMKDYGSVRKNFGKTAKLKKLQASEDDHEWEGYVALFFDNFREKKTA